MTQKLDANEMQNALALSQAACYASMSAKEHREGSPQGDQMLQLTTKLVAMTMASLDAAILPEILPKAGEPTLADFVQQAKDAHAAGDPAPEIVLTAPLPEADIVLTPPADPDFIPTPEAQTLADEDWKPTPVPSPLPE